MKFKTPLLTAAILAAIPAAQANWVVFGDSLSDIGQTDWRRAATFEDPNGQPHKLYDQILQPTLKSSSAGGTNYAYSGGVILGEHSTSFKDQPNVAINNQVSNYLNKGASKNAQYILWAGGNDLAWLLGAVAQTNEKDRQTFVQQEIQKMAQEMAKQTARLAKTGGQLVIPTIPNITETPAFFETYGDAVEEKIKKAFSWGFKKQLETLSQKMLNKQNLSKEEFKKLRSETLETAAKEFYSSLSRFSLLRWAKTEKEFIKEVMTNYKQITAAGEFITPLLNDAVTKAVTAQSNNVVRINTTALLDDMLWHSQDYGIKQITLPVCKTDTWDTTKPACKPTDSDPLSYLFADSFHPGPIAHLAFANYIQAVLAIPQELMAIPFILNRNIQDNYGFLRQTDRFTDKTGITATLSQSRFKQGFNTHLNIATHITPNYVWQLQFNQNNSSHQQGQTHFSTDAKSVQTAFTYQQPNYYVGVAAGAEFGHVNTQRTSQIGSARRSASTNFDQQSLNAMLFTGYQWQLNPVNLELGGDILWNRMMVDSATSNGSPLMEMHFKQRTQTSLQTGLNAKVTLNVAQIKPYLQARLSKEWISQDAALTTIYNGAQFITNQDNGRPLYLSTALGVSYQAPSLPLTINASLAQDLKTKLLDKRTDFNLSLSYAF